MKTGICFIVVGSDSVCTAELVAHLADAGCPALDRQAGPSPWSTADLGSLHTQILEAFDASPEDGCYLPNNWWKSPIARFFRPILRECLPRPLPEYAFSLAAPSLEWMLPLWLDLLAEENCSCQILLAIRRPDANGNIAPCYEIEARWLARVAAAECASRSIPRHLLVLDHPDYAWPAQLTRIFHSPFSGNTKQPQTNPPTRIPQASAPPLYEEWYRVLLMEGLDGKGSQALALLAEDKLGVIAPWREVKYREVRSQENLGATLAALRYERDQLQTELARVKGTVSWQITKPLRLIANSLRRLRLTD